MVKNFTWCEHRFTKSTRKLFSFFFPVFFSNNFTNLYFVPWSTVCYCILRLILLVSMCYVVCLERISMVGSVSKRWLCTFADCDWLGDFCVAVEVVIFFIIGHDDLSRSVLLKVWKSFLRQLLCCHL
jgi:hypothetical protein